MQLSRSLRRLVSLLSASALVATMAVVAFPATPVSAAVPTGTVIFDNTAAVQPPNLPSVGYEATSTSEWGTQIHFTGTQRSLTKVVVTMSDWALNSTYAGMPASGWTHPITLNLYNVGGTLSNPAPGALIKSVTQTFTIPWRPEPDGCGGSTTAYTANAICYNGKAFNITFDLTGQGVVAPSELIASVAYNTSDYGASPLRAAAPAGGPYDSLNVATYPGTGDGTVASTPSVGTFPYPMGTYLNSSWAGAYGDGGATTGTFRFDSSSWGSYQPAVQVTALPVCTATGFVRDGIDMTAAQIGGTVTGTLDATGCNIGAYFNADHPGSVSNATIFGANYFGVVANHVALDVTNSTIRNIGEAPLNGTQHGNAVVYINGATGAISGNTIRNYQKNGITVSGKAADGVALSSSKTSATVSNNIVTGEGPITYIAQNGIQISYGATAIVKGNSVSGDNYTPTSYVACGLLLYQAGGVNASGNNLFNNERNQCNFGKGGGQLNP